MTVHLLDNIPLVLNTILQILIVLPEHIDRVHQRYLIVK